MTRGEKAASIRHDGVPGQWRHKPAALPTGLPDITGLTAGEQETINNWLKYIHIGGITAPSLSVPTQLGDGSGTVMTAAANTKIADILTYLEGNAYLAWRDQNLLRREAQYRLTLVDAIEEAVTSGTVPASSDPTGAGSGAPTATTIPAST